LQQQTEDTDSAAMTFNGQNLLLALLLVDGTTY